MEEQLCYQFQLNQFSLNITETTIRVLNNFILKSGFHKLPLKGVARVFNDSARDGLITKSQFDACILKILSLSDISEVDKVGCAMTLSSVFYAFDRTDSNVVDIVDLICGIAVLCDGSKSVKLAFAFELMDEDGDGLLSKRGLWRYFRAFLCTLLTISGASLEMGSDELTAICDDSAVWTCSQLLASLQTRGNSRDVVRGCSFEDLADWYTQGGYVVATWLELLDLSKWLPLRPLEEPSRPKSAKNSQFQADTRREASPSPPLPENPYVDEDGPEIFRAELAGGQSLSLKESDSNFVLEVAQLTGFYNMSPPLLIGRLVQHARDNGTITIANYNSFVSNTVPDELVSARFSDYMICGDV
jgi:Ca2+-binding EF-hand superfamily protein